MPTYFLNGKESRGEEYIAAIDSVAAASTDDPDWIRVSISDAGTLMISTGLGGLSVTDERPDGSSWTKYEITKDEVKDLVTAFLNGSIHWRNDTEWELTEIAPGDARRRMLWIMLCAAGLGGFVWALTKIWKA